MGSGLSFPPLFFMQIIGMAITGFIGGLFKSFFLLKKTSMISLISLGFLGFFCTFIYDFLTLISYPLSAGLGMSGIMAALVKGIGFTEFDASDVVRHPMVAKIIRAYDANKKEK